MLLVIKRKTRQENVYESSDILSAFITHLRKSYLDIDLGIGLQLMYYAVSGAVLLIVGVAILREKGNSSRG